MYRAALWALSRPQGKLQDHDLEHFIDIGFQRQSADIAKAFFIHHYKQHLQRPVDPETYLPIAKRMLDILNDFYNNRKELTLSFKNGLLKIPEEPYQNFVVEPYRINLLSPLNIKELDLSHTGFYEVVELRGLKIHTLNLSGCPLPKFKEAHINALKSIGVKKLKVQSGDFDSKELKRVHEAFEVEFVD